MLYPRQQAAIVPKISAPVKRLYVQRGARVRAGQLLLELENQDLAGAAAESRAAFDLAEATFETTARATVPEEVNKAELDRPRPPKIFSTLSRRALRTARISTRKARSLRKSVNEAQANLSQARSQYETAKKRLEDLQGFARDQAIKAASSPTRRCQGSQ